jgi:large subunit ribosomal protein L22
MESRAVTKFVWMSPRKARLVVDLVRGKQVEDALAVLEFTPKRAAKVIAKTVKSAVANAEDTQNVDVDRLYVKKAFVDDGPLSWRWKPRAHGRATGIRKRTAHITIVVDERSSSKSSSKGTK